MRIFIAEDEPLAAQKLQLFLQKLGEEDTTVFDNGANLVEALKTTPKPDLLFLDIQMPGLTGIEVLQHLQTPEQQKGNKELKVIITSAYDQYAIDGFNFGVADYLLKPYTLDRLRQALAKVRPEQVINIRVEGRTVPIRVTDIVSLSAQKDYTEFTLADGQKLLTIGTLTGFEQQLPAMLFSRIQRSYLVGLRHVKNYSASVVSLTTSEELPIGRTYRDSFRQALKALI
ncbi:MAG: response regulator transcription factor [Bacteroidales bacterium]|nr:response regulator transcription factor [Bacteroidales bacterium]